MSLHKDLETICNLPVGGKLGVDANSNLYHSTNFISRWFYSQNRMKTISRLQQIVEELESISATSGDPIATTTLVKVVDSLNKMRDLAYNREEDTVFVSEHLQPVIDRLNRLITHRRVPSSVCVLSESQMPLPPIYTRISVDIPGLYEKFRSELQ